MGLRGCFIVQKNRDWKEKFISRGHVSRDWQWCKIYVTDQMFCLADRIMDVDDDDENAAAAHAAFVMTVSAARTYWLLRHAQHTRDISSDHFRKKIGLGSADFLHSGTRHTEIAVFVLLLIFLPISVRNFQKERCSFWKIQSWFQPRFPAQCNTPFTEPLLM